MWNRHIVHKSWLIVANAYDSHMLLVAQHVNAMKCTHIVVYACASITLLQMKMLICQQEMNKQKKKSARESERKLNVWHKTFPVARRNRQKAIEINFTIQLLLHRYTGSFCRSHSISFPFISIFAYFALSSQKKHFFAISIKSL